LILLPFLLLLLLRFTPAYPWLLERAPDSLLQRLEQGSPGDPWPALLLGERLLARGEPSAALQRFERAGQLGASDSRWGIDVIDSLSGSGLHESAVTQAQALLQFEPKSGRLQRILGQSQLRLGQTREGMAALETATRLAPYDAGAWLALAEARTARLEPGMDLLGTWETAVKQCPQSAALRQGLAHSYIELARYTEAEPLLVGLERQPAPQDPAARGAYVRAWYARGVVLHRLRPDAQRRAQAKEALSRVHTLSPGYPDAYYEEGLLLAEEGDHIAARSALETAVRLKPQAPPFWYQLSMLCRKEDPARSRAAEARFQLLVRTERDVAVHSNYLAAHPEDTARRIRLARLLLQRQDRVNAARQLTIALRSAPANAEARQLLRGLGASSPSGEPTHER
jgi:tetratricopeptide (TPR) repeat protein